MTAGFILLIGSLIFLVLSLYLLHKSREILANSPPDGDGSGIFHGILAFIFFVVTLFCFGIGVQTIFNMSQ